MSRPALQELLRTETDRIEWKQSAKDGAATPIVDIQQEQTENGWVLRGVRRVRSLLSKNGHPPLVVETDGYTRITVGRRP